MILVTGASGLLGAAVLLQAREWGRQVAGISKQHVLRVPGIDVYPVDLGEPAATRKIVETLRPTLVIHCAAATNVDWCEEHPEQTHRLNVCVSSFLAELAREMGAAFLFVSTDSVFDGKKGNYSEDDPPGPLNIYAKSKLAAEKEVLRTHHSALVVRVNIYGWNAQNKQSLAEWILSELSAGKQVPGFSDIYFSPILVNHLAQILLTMCDRGLSGVYHVAGAEKISKYEFAKRTAMTFGLSPEQVVPVRASEAKLRAPRPRDISLCTEKICKELGITMPGVEAGLDKFKELREQGWVRQLKGYGIGATG